MTVAIILSGLEYDRHIEFLKEYNPRRVYIFRNTKIIKGYNEEIQHKVDVNVELMCKYLKNNPFMKVKIVETDYFNPYQVFEQLLRIMRDEVKAQEDVKVCVVGGLTPLRIYAHLAASVFYPHVQTVYIYGGEYYPPLEAAPYQLVKGMWRLEIIPPIPLMNFERLDRYEKGILIALETKGPIQLPRRKRTREILRRLVELGFISEREASTRSASVRVGQALDKLQALKFVKVEHERGICDLTPSGRLAAIICKVLTGKG